MATGPPSLIEASLDLNRVFGIDADALMVSRALDSQGVYDEPATRTRIEHHKSKILERHKSTGAQRVQKLTECVYAVEDARDLRHGLYIVEGLVLGKKYGLGREQHPQQYSLGMEKEAPPLPPRKGFISTQQLNNAGSRSPHFNRRSHSRSRIRSDTGDSPASNDSSSTLVASPGMRPFGNSFNQAIAARDAGMPKLATRTRSNLISTEFGQPRSPLELERARAYDRERAQTTPTVHGVPSHYSTPSSTATSMSVNNRLFDEQLRHSASSSPVSAVSSATPSTVIHVAPTATLRAMAGICGRAAGANEVADDVLATGLIRALTGFQSSYFRLSDGVFRMSTGCAVSGTKRGGLVRMLEQATHALAMQLPSAQGADLMTEAFIVGLQETRRRFTQFVIALERKYAPHSLNTRAIVAAMTRTWDGAVGRVAALATLPKQHQMKGMTILHELYLHYTTLVHTGGEEEEVIIALLDAVMFVFANLLRRWLLDGTLNIHNTEFLIKERKGHGGEQDEAAMIKSWHTRFNLDKARTPPFLDFNLPKMILSVGKCARLLASDDVDDELSAHRSRVARLDLSRLYCRDGNERAVLMTEMEAIERSICGLVVQRLLQRDQLKEHLRAIHHIFLCLDERYATDLFEAIDVMCRDVATVSATRTQHAASLAFISAARTAALAFPFKLPVDAVVKESLNSSSSSSDPSPPPSARSCRDRARIVVTPTYKAPRLAAIVLGKAEVEHYQTLFHTIWPVYSTRLALSEARRELLFTSDEYRALGKGTSSSLRAFQLALSTAGPFFDNLIRYYNHAAEQQSVRLRARLDKANTVEECIKAHESFLVHMADYAGVTLAGDKRGVPKRLIAIQNARSVLLEEASALLDLFWLWVGEAQREQLLRKQKESDEMEMGADAQSTTLREFEKMEEKIRREETEKHQVASSTKINAIFSRFKLQMHKFLDLYETDGKQNELTKLLLAMKVKNEKAPEPGKRLAGPSPRWRSNKA